MKKHLEKILFLLPWICFAISAIAGIIIAIVYNIKGEDNMWVAVASIVGTIGGAIIGLIGVVWKTNSKNAKKEDIKVSEENICNNILQQVGSDDKDTLMGHHKIIINELSDYNSKIFSNLQNINSFVDGERAIKNNIAKESDYLKIIAIQREEDKLRINNLENDNRELKERINQLSLEIKSLKNDKQKEDKGFSR